MMFCWPVTLVRVSKIPSEIDTEISQKVFTLAEARRAKKMCISKFGSWGSSQQLISYHHWLPVPMARFYTPAPRLGVIKL
jgi:hypothetical protein